MKTDKPLVSILLAVYKANKDWLILLLQSLDSQTYSNIELLIWDDCPDYPVDETIFATYITKFRYTLYRGKKNLGSNGAFEELTKLATGKYISYCDQDDIWCKHKTETLVEILEQTDAPLVCSDVFIINEKGKVIGKSIKDAHKRHEFHTGGNVAQRLVFKNFVMGCALMIKTSIAQEALPFCKLVVHDHWLGIFSALYGKVEICKEPLLYYRKHSANQTGVLAGVKDKNTYYDIRLVEHYNRIIELQNRLQDAKELEHFFYEYVVFTESKMRYFKKPNIQDLKIMVHYRKFGKHQVLFEVLLHFTPDVVFNFLVKLTQKGVL